jgi:hypothetical protein
MLNGSNIAELIAFFAQRNGAQMCMYGVDAMNVEDRRIV